MTDADALCVYPLPKACDWKRNGRL